jgi:hypothetical protein
MMGISQFREMADFRHFPKFPLWISQPSGINLQAFFAFVTVNFPAA